MPIPLTAMMFANGHVVLGVVSGLVLSIFAAAALRLTDLAWSMSAFEVDTEEVPLHEEQTA